MSIYPLNRIRVIIPVLAVFLLAVLAACGSSATSTPAGEASSETTAAPTVVIPSTVIGKGDESVTISEEVPTAVPLELVAGSRYWDSFSVGAKYGGILRNGDVGEPDHWDLHQSCCNPGPAAARDLYNNLVMFDPIDQSTLVGDLAESWEWSDDGLSLTFRIRENASWHDGTPVTSDDIAFSLDRMVQEDVSRPRVQNVKPYYENTETPDARTAKVNVQFPSPAAFLPFLAVDYMSMLPKHILEGREDVEDYFDAPENIVGSGAYTFVSYDRGSRWELEKNNDYFKEGLPFADGRVTNLITDPSRLATAIETEQIMVTIRSAGLSNPSAVTLQENLAEQGHGDLYFSGETIIGMFQMNWTEPPFDDPKVRRAVYLALDRQELIDVALLGYGTMGTPFYPNTWMSTSMEEVAEWPGFRYVDASGNPVDSTTDGAVKDPQDLEEARKLLAAAGHEDGLEVDYHTYASNKPVVLTIKEQLKKVGIEVNINITDLTTVIAAEQAGTFPNMLAVHHGPNIVDPDDLFSGVYLPGGPRNPLDFEDARLVELFGIQKQEPDREKRLVLLKEAEDIIRHGEMHTVVYYWYSTPAYFANKKIKNFVPRLTVQYGHGTEHLWIDD